MTMTFMNSTFQHLRLVPDIEDLPDGVRSNVHCRETGCRKCQARSEAGLGRRLHVNLEVLPKSGVVVIHKSGIARGSTSARVPLPLECAQASRVEEALVGGRPNPRSQSGLHSYPAFAFSGYSNWTRYDDVGQRCMPKVFPATPQGGVKPPGLILQEAMDANGATCFWWALREIVPHQWYAAGRVARLPLEPTGITVTDAVAMANPLGALPLGFAFNVCHIAMDGTLMDSTTNVPWFSQPRLARNVPVEAFVCFVWFDDTGKFDPHWLPFVMARGLRHVMTDAEKNQIAEVIAQWNGLVVGPAPNAPLNVPDWVFGAVAGRRFDWGRHTRGVLGQNTPWVAVEECSLVVTDKPVWADPRMDGQRIVYTTDVSSTYSAEVDQGAPSFMRRFWAQSVIRQNFGLAPVAWSANARVLLQAEVRSGDLIFAPVQEWPRSSNELPGGELNLSQMHSLRLSTGVAFPLGSENRFYDHDGREWVVREVHPPITMNVKTVLAILPFLDELVSGFSWYRDRDVTIDDYPSPDIYVWTRYRALILSLRKEEVYLSGILNRAMESALDNKDYSDPFVVGNQIITDVRDITRRQGASVPGFATA